MMENIPSLLYYGGSDTELLADMGIPFDTPKATSVCQEHIQALSGDGDIVLDFFSGSATTAHATLLANLADGKNRRIISVQLPEPMPIESDAYSMGFKTLCDMGKERIKKAGEMVRRDCKDLPLPDLGFRVLKLDDSNFVEPKSGALMLDVVKPGRSDIDIVFECMLRWGLDLTLPVERDEIGGYPCYSVAADELICCMAPGLTEDTFDEIVARSPKRVLIRDSILDDTLKFNAVVAFGRGTAEGDEIKLRTV